MDNQEVEVHDPIYVVRSRLGTKLDGGESREDQIEDMGSRGKQVDQETVSEIRRDYEKEVGDVLSDLNDPTDFGGAMGKPQNPLDKMKPDESMSEEEANERIRDMLKVSSLKIAYQGYSVFKSIALN
jgi:hypothetical protein